MVGWVSWAQNSEHTAAVLAWEGSPLIILFRRFRMISLNLYLKWAGPQVAGTFPYQACRLSLRGSALPVSEPYLAAYQVSLRRFACFARLGWKLCGQRSLEACYSRGLGTAIGRLLSWDSLC